MYLREEHASEAHEEPDADRWRDAIRASSSTVCVEVLVHLEGHIDYWVCDGPCCTTPLSPISRDDDGD